MPAPLHSNLVEVTMFKYTVTINIHHTDLVGILYFGRLFEIAHTVYEAFLESKNIHLAHIITTKPYLLPIVHCNADYRRPMYLGEKLQVELTNSAFGEKSYTLQYLFKNSEGLLKANVTTIHAAVDKKTFQSILVPSEVREIVQSLHEFV